MNKVYLMGRLTRDPDIRYTQGAEQMCIARYTLAVDRRFKKEGGQTADFISCVAFAKAGEFAEKYFYKGIKIAISGRIQTGKYERDGQTHYTTDVVVEEQEFCESKAVSEQNRNSGNYASEPERDFNTSNSDRGSGQTDAGDGFMNIPDDIDANLPFN